MPYFLTHSNHLSLSGGDGGGVGGGGPEKLFFQSSTYLQRVIWTSLKMQLNPAGSIASQVGSVPVFLRKPIATFDFLWG